MIGVHEVRLPFGARVLIEVDSTEVVDDLRLLGERIQDPRPVYRSAANIMRRSFAENFRSGGRPVGWKPLQPNTIAAKTLDPRLSITYRSPRARKVIRRLEQNGNRSESNILIARGDLRDSYVQKNANHVERISLNGLEIGSKHPLAAFHEYGTKPYVILPRRARYLAFMTVAGWTFRGKVNHPGLEARPVAVVQEEDADSIKAAFDAHLAPV